MNATVSSGPAATPWHLWAVGILSLCWNAFGAYDYVMTVTHDASYLAGMPPGAMAIVDAFPAWAVGAWAIGVWVSLLGALLLLIRSRHATTAFLVSLAGALVSYAYQATTGLPAAMGGGSYWVMPAVIVIVIVAQWYYAKRMTDAGVLR
jgi:hypothetical protein